MALRVYPVVSGSDLESFVRLPWSLYAASKQWVPPLLSQEKELLQPALHPFWDHATRRLFLCANDGVVIGRVAAIIDQAYNSYVDEPCGAFGFFECTENPAAAKMLLDACASWLQQNGLQYLRGPVNPSTNYTCGLLVDGFEQYPALMMPYNPPYYAHLLEHCGLRKEQDLFAYRIYKDRLTIAPTLAEHIAQSENSGRFTCRKADKRHLKRDIAIMLDLYKRSWAQNWYFTPLSAEEEEHLVKELLPVVDPDFFVLFFQQDEPAAGMVALPDYTPLLHRLNGHLSPLLPWHYLQTRALTHRHLRIMLFGILPEYRLFGLPALLFKYMLGQAQLHPELEWVEGSWVLEDNQAICDLIEDFSGTIAMRYRIYRTDFPDLY